MFRAINNKTLGKKKQNKTKKTNFFLNKLASDTILVSCLSSLFPFSVNAVDAVG